jgi:hypothetical protein
MKSIHKKVILLILVGILLVSLYPLREGFPSTSSYTVAATDHGLKQSLLDRIQDVPPPYLVYTRQADVMTTALTILFDAGATPCLVIYIPEAVETSKATLCITQLQQAMKLNALPNTIYRYVPSTSTYTIYMGKCKDGTLKANPEGTNCA